MLVVCFGYSIHHPRVVNLRVFCFLLTVLYHVLVTVWCRVWWRARLYNSIVVVAYVVLLWWLVLIYKDAGEIPLGLTFFVAAYKTVDVYLVFSTTI